MAAYNELMQLNEVERSVCEYCKGNTKMDDYGQCRACGAPKPTIPQMNNYLPTYVQTIESCAVVSTGAIDYGAPGGVWR